MIEVVKLEKTVRDEEERERVRAVIAERAAYYERLFAAAAHPPRITLRYEGERPLTIRAVFAPHAGAPVAVTVASYLAADRATKYALKKLRRVAKNYFVKTKRRRRGAL